MDNLVSSFCLVSQSTCFLLTLLFWVFCFHVTWVWTIHLIWIATCLCFCLYSKIIWQYPSHPKAATMRLNVVVIVVVEERSSLPSCRTNQWWLRWKAWGSNCSFVWCAWDRHWKWTWNWNLLLRNHVNRTRNQCELIRMFGQVIHIKQIINPGYDVKSHALQHSRVAL